MLTTGTSIWGLNGHNSPCRFTYLCVKEPTITRKASSGCQASAACNPAVRCASNSASKVADRAGALSSGSGAGRKGITVLPLSASANSAAMSSGSSSPLPLCCSAI